MRSSLYQKLLSPQHLPAESIGTSRRDVAFPASASRAKALRVRGFLRAAPGAGLERGSIVLSSGSTPLGLCRGKAAALPPVLARRQSASAKCTDNQAADRCA